MSECDEQFLNSSEGNEILLHVQNSYFASTRQQGGRAEGMQGHEDFRLGLPSNDITCRLPVILSEAQCYTDTSLTPGSTTKESWNRNFHPRSSSPP